MDTYIWQQNDWPVFTFDTESLFPALTEVAHLQGKVEALSGQLGFAQSKELEARILSDEIHNSHKIEGEILEELQIYTSLCRRLKVPNVSMKLSGPHVEGVVEICLMHLGMHNSRLLKEDCLHGIPDCFHKDAVVLSLCMRVGTEQRLSK